MKRMLSTTEYVFYAGSNYIDFSMYPDFDPKRLLAIINITKNQTLIYAVGGGPTSHTGGTFSGSIGSYFLSLVFDCSGAGMSDTDILEMIYDDSVGIEDAKSSLDIISNKYGLDVNLLNSSFGGTVGDVMPAPFQDNALSIGVLNGGVLESPAMNVNNELIVDVTQSGDVPITGTVGVYGSVTVDNFPVTQAVTGTFWQTTQPVSASSLPLPSGASTSALQTTGNTSLSSIDGKLNSLGQKVSASSMPVVVASDQILNTAPNAPSATGNITALNGTVTVSLAGYTSCVIDLRGTYTATITFQGTVDGTNWIALVGTPYGSNNNVAAVSTSTTSGAWLVQCAGCIQVRALCSAYTSGTSIVNIRATMANAWNYSVAVGATNNVAISSGTVTTVSTVSAVTSSAMASATVTDIASAAITTTQTSGNITTLNTQAASWLVTVSAISGTNASMDVVIQETMDATNYYTVYSFERITATGQYYSPCIKLSGSGYRVVRTVSGTTPSITNSVVRISRSGQAETARRFINRTIDPNTLNSNTGSFFCDGVEDFNIMVRCTAQTTPATISLEFSNDNVNWFTSTVTVSTVNGIAREKVQNEQWKFVRATVTAAGSGITLDNVVIGGHSA